MSDIDELLGHYKDDGVEDSSGAFTIDFQKAREKLAKFQLADPHELVLKFVQAGNLAAQRVSLSAAPELLVVLFSDWDHELTLERLAERLASASLIVGDDPLTHLCIGLSALLALAPEGIKVRQVLPDQAEVKTLVVGQTLDWETEEGFLGSKSSLEISASMPKKLSAKALKELLIERCAFSSVPIFWENHELEGRPPQTAGAHRPIFFRENRVLASHALRARGHGKLNLSEPWAKSAKVKAEERTAFLNLTVDLDPKATIWLCKAGVLAERKRFDLGIPGIVGVVAADDLATDLTGSQFLDGPGLDGVREWLRECAMPLLEDAILDSKSVMSEAQPVSKDAPVNLTYGCTGCTVSLLGWLLGVFLISRVPGPSGGSEWVMPNLFFWIFFPMIWVFIAVRRHGCEKDEKSDKEAKRELFATLSHAKISATQMRAAKRG